MQLMISSEQRRRPGQEVSEAMPDTGKFPGSDAFRNHFIYMARNRAGVGRANGPGGATRLLTIQNETFFIKTPARPHQRRCSQ